MLGSIHVFGSKQRNGSGITIVVVASSRNTGAGCPTTLSACEVALVQFCMAALSNHAALQLGFQATALARVRTNHGLATVATRSFGRNARLRHDDVFVGNKNRGPCPIDKVLLVLEEDFEVLSGLFS